MKADMTNRKRIIICVAILLICAIAVITIDALWLQKGTGDYQLAPYRLILPSKADADSIGSGMPMDEVFAIMGRPQRLADTSGVFGWEWDLNNGEVYAGFGGGPELMYGGVDPEQFSTRFLVFPGILLVIALLEVVFCFISRRNKIKP